jgi:hypothetical protein
LGTLSPCWRSLLATIENVTRLRKDIQFSSEKLTIILPPPKVKYSLYHAFNIGMGGLKVNLKEKFSR